MFLSSRRTRLLVAQLWCLLIVAAAPVRADQEALPISVGNDSRVLVRAGENAKKYFYELIQKRNEYAKEHGSKYHFEVIDARDPHLYRPGEPIQPRVPADLVLVRVSQNGAYQVSAYLIDQPGALVVKEFPSGGLLANLGYSADFITYASKFDGLYASVTRNASSAGWGYVYYLKGFGNNVSPQQFDQAVGNFLRNLVLYVTPL